MACLYPQRYKIGSTQLFPCGKCDSCIKKKQTDWVTRLILEAKNSNNAVIFGTLTYSDEHLPDSHLYQGGTLRKSDIQSFTKRLKRNFYYKYPHDKMLRYYIAGEYGKKSTTRAHYHFLLFNVDLQKHHIETIIKNSWKLCEPEHIDIQLIGSASMAKSAIKTFSGTTTQGSVFSELAKSIRYVSKYVLKKDGDSTLQDREPEFSLKSSHPPLGTTYFHKLAPMLIKHNLYPLQGFSPYYRFLFHEVYLLDETINAKEWNGTFLISNDLGNIDLNLSDRKIELAKKHKHSSFYTLDAVLQKKLLDYTYPDLINSLDYYVSLLSNKEKTEQSKRYNDYQSAIQWESYDNYINYRTKPLLEYNNYSQIKQDSLTFDKIARQKQNAIAKM